MTVRNTILLLVIGCVVSLIMAFAVRADEAVCQTPEQVAAFANEQGDTIAGAAYYRGATTDSVLVVESTSAIILYGFKDGCLVAAMALEPREAETPA